MFARTETIPFGTFMKKEKKGEKKELKIKDIIERVNDPKLKKILTTTATLIILGKTAPLLTIPVLAQAVYPEAVPAAALTDAVKNKIIHAFDPLINVVQALSYPVAAVMITTGCLFIMVGNKEKGMNMLTMAGIGYILVQLSPVIMQILVGIGGMV